jgi:hypothetical protein
MKTLPGPVSKQDGTEVKDMQRAQLGMGRS